MIIVAGPRGTGKTEKLFEKARENNYMIISANAHALRVKAKALGYEDLEINGLGDLKNDDYSFAKGALVDNGDYILSYMLDKYYNIKVEGLSVTTFDPNLEKGKKKGKKGE